MKKRPCDTCLNNKKFNGRYDCWYRYYQIDIEYWSDRWNGKEKECENYEKRKVKE